MPDVFPEVLLNRGAPLDANLVRLLGQVDVVDAPVPVHVLGTKKAKREAWENGGKNDTFRLVCANMKTKREAWDKGGGNEAFSLVCAYTKTTREV